MNWNLEHTYTEIDLKKNASKAIKSMVIFETLLMITLLFCGYQKWIDAWLITFIIISCLTSISFGISIQKKLWTPTHDAIDRLLDIRVPDDIRARVNRYIDEVKHQGRYLSYYEVAKINTFLRMNSSKE